jgi:gliding motility-associated-like protein
MTPYGSLLVALRTRAFINTPNYPCLTEPDICVEEGIYQFETTLPNVGESYHISYQRCCRNITINNIVNPQSQGATYTVELLPGTASLCNSSPTFDDFPPTVVCGNSPLRFDHSATDPDGDQLVYEFCAPFQGGGPNTMAAQLNLCFGAAPTPACPPPYSAVPFLPPLYSAQIPMGGRPNVTINPVTGVITGTPDVQGQFVVGVCVSEYRNGVLLSKIFRDFQFNVENCDPEVVADLQEDIKLDQQTFQVNSCGSTEIQFINQSFQEEFIDEYVWSFNIRNDVVVYREWEPLVTFPGIGQYDGTLILNPGTECSDTAYIFVNVYPDLEADFSYEYDTCVAGDVVFTDLSRTGAKYITDWDWRFGDGQFSKEQDPVHFYTKPGNIPVTLSIIDTNLCEETVTKNIQYFPVPALLVISPDAMDGCEPVDIFFNNLSVPIDSTYDIFWNFGDGGNSGRISPTHTYEDIGTFTVDLSVVSPIGCIIDTVFPDLITVLPSPDAGFSYGPEDISIINPEVRFIEETQNAAQINWDFGDGRTSNMASPQYVYRDTGIYQVIQTVTHPNGCVDTAFTFIDIRPEVRYFLPNAFTPNQDGLNDEYRGVGIMDGARNFVMTIWNRWGQQLYESTDPNSGWNGRIFNSGDEVPNGVYVVQVSFQGPRGEKFEYKTFATLIR